VLQGTYIYGAPQWILRLLGSALPEVGTVVQGIAALDPLSASVLLPATLWLLLGQMGALKWLAIGTSIGIIPGLISQIFAAPEILRIGTGIGSQVFLAANVLACVGLNALMLKPLARSTATDRRNPKPPTKTPVSATSNAGTVDAGDP
jgi:serine protease